MGRSWNTAQYLIMIGVILSVIGFIFDRLLMPVYVRQGDSLIMPDTQEMTVEEAEALLTSKGFKVIFADPKFTVAFPPGVVYEQIPFPGTRVKSGRRVYLTPTAEEQLVAVPSLFGISERNAILEIERSGFILDTLIYDYSRFPEGAVISQSIPKGTDAKRGGGIRIEVSLGPQPDRYIVPQLVEKSLNSARELLAKSGLREGRLSYRIDNNLIPYTVLGQSLRPGLILYERSKVDLIISVTTVEEVEEPSPEGGTEEL